MNNVWSGATPPPIPPNPQVQIIMGQLQGQINSAVNEKVAPIAQALTEALGRQSQIEQVIAEIAKRISSTPSDDFLFDQEERRILILNSANVYDKKEVRALWERHQAEKRKAAEASAVVEEAEKDGTGE